VNWKALKEGMVIVIGAGLLITVYDVRTNQDEAKLRGYDSRASTCRTNLALNQPIKEGEPCAQPEIREITDTFEIVKIGTSADHHMTQTLLCNVPVVYQSNVEDCERILSGS
jgi:hypothetical protein